MLKSKINTIGASFLPAQLMHTDFWNSGLPQDNSPSVEGTLHALSIDLNPVHHASHSPNSAHVYELLHNLQGMGGTYQPNDHSFANGLHQLLQNLNQSIDPLHNDHCLKHQHHFGLSESHSSLLPAQTPLTSHGHSSFASTFAHLNLLSTADVSNLPASSTHKFGESFTLDLQPHGQFELNTGLGSQDFSAHHVASQSTSSGSFHNEPVTLHSPPHAQVMQSCGGAITPDTRRSVDIDNYGFIYWHDRGHIIGKVDGHNFFDSSNYYEGRLSTSLKVYDKNDNYIGYVTPNGCAYTPDGQLFAKGGTPLWAAATLLYNLR